MQCLVVRRFIEFERVPLDRLKLEVIRSNVYAVMAPA